MKLPSLRLAFQDARDTFLRFPVIIINAILGSCAAFILIDYEGPEQPTILFKVLLSAVLGLPLLLSFALYAERNAFSKAKGLILQGIGILLLILYSFTVPLDMRYAPESVILRFVTLGVALVFLVLSMPATAGGNENGFWHFNWRLFIRIMLAGLYTVVLFSGFALALAALDNLFGVHVRPQRYGELWVMLLGLFAPWFILAGVPADRAQLESETGYPKGLKVFALYILGTIVLAYLIILYAYLIKILMAWDWPKGWVSGLVFGFASCGILLTVILKPLIEREGLTWIRRAVTVFYIILVPLIVMLFLAIGRRVSDYGITESRYLAFATAGWLVIIVAYYLLSRKKSLWFIPFSLCLGALVISSGPWGMFGVAETSQIGRLERLLTARSVLKDGKITTDHPAVPAEDAQQISSILDYLRGRHGFAGIQPWFSADLHGAWSANGQEYKTAAAVAELMGIRFYQTWEGPNGGNIVLTSTKSFRVQGYEHMARLPQFTGAGGPPDTLAGGICVIKADGLNTLIFTRADTSQHILTVDLGAHADAIIEGKAHIALTAIPDSVMTIRASANGLSVCLCPWTMTTWKREGQRRVNYLEGIVLYTYQPQSK